jgi:hypothetical protein
LRQSAGVILGNGEEIMVNKKNQNVLFLLVMTIVLGCSQVVISFAQLPQEQTKSIQSDEFIKNRPASSKPAEGRVRPSSYITRTRTYPVVKKRIIPPRKSTVRNNVAENAMLGLTIWKQGPAPKDEATKGLIEEDAGLQRIESETALAVNDRIRFSVESLSRKGYLYIIDRELYSDGTYSAPKLIYPTLNYRNGNNLISAGNPIFVPQSSNYFVVTPQQGEKKQVAEVLTIIVSPKILIDPSMLDTKAINIPPAQFASWLKQYEVETTLLEQVNGAGSKITPVEQAAAREAAKGLLEESSSFTQGDPPPQSVYLAKIKRSEPLLVNVFLKFRSN